MSASLAPGLQSSPISFGKTTVLSPHGIAVIIKTMGKTSVNFKPKQIK